MTQKAGWNHGIRMGCLQGKEIHWVEAEAAKGRPLGGGFLYGGLLAISHLNNSFAYSKLNEQIIIDINSFSL